MASWQCNLTLRGHFGPINSVRFNSNGKYCMTTGHDRTISLWNPHREGEKAGNALLIKSYQGHGKAVNDVCITKDNSKFASCGADQDVFVWDVATAQIVRKYRGHAQRAQINAVAFNKDESVLASGSYDRKICMWDLRSHTWTPIQVMDDFKDSVTSLIIQDVLVIAASVDGCIRMYDVRNGMIFTDNLYEAITSITLSGDSNCLLASCIDSTLRLVEKDTGELLNEYRDRGYKHKSYPLRGCLSNDDAYVISGSEDSNIRFWDLVDGKVTQKLSGHTKTVSSVAYHPKEDCLVSVSYDGTGRVWAPA